MRFEHMSYDQKLTVLLEEFDRSRIREARNTRYILRVLLARMDAQDTKLDQILAAIATKKGVIEFGKPQPKATPNPPLAGKSGATSKEKPHGDKFHD